MYKIWKRLGLQETFDTVEKTWLAKSAGLSGIHQSVNCYATSGFLRCFRDSFRVHRIENQVSRIRENYQRVPRIKENRLLRIREIGSVQVHTGYPTKKLRNVIVHHVKTVKLLIVALHGISEMIMMNRRGYCLHCTYLV